MSAEAVPRVSSHARLRFVHRAGVDASSTARAWREGTAVDVEAHNYHQARYNAARDVVLLARNGVITTVLDAAYEEFKGDVR